MYIRRKNCKCKPDILKKKKETMAVSVEIGSINEKNLFEYITTNRCNNFIQGI